MLPYLDVTRSASWSLLKSYRDALAEMLPGESCASVSYLILFVPDGFEDCNGVCNYDETCSPVDHAVGGECVVRTADDDGSCGGTVEGVCPATAGD